MTDIHSFIRSVKIFTFNTQFSKIFQIHILKCINIRSSSRKSQAKFRIKFQERALRFVDGINGDYEVSEGISLVQSPESSRQQGARALKDESLSAEPAVRENQIEGLLVDRVARFLEGHTLQFKVPKDSIDEMKRSMEEGA